MKTITKQGKRYIVKKVRTRINSMLEVCELCAFKGECPEKGLKCISLIGLHGYLVKDTLINRLKTLLRL